MLINLLEGQAELCSLTYRECYGQKPDEARCRTSIGNLILLFITNCTSSYQRIAMAAGFALEIGLWRGHSEFCNRMPASIKGNSRSPHIWEAAAAV